jgi:hypothetical protein
MIAQLRKLRHSTSEKRPFRAREEPRDFVSTRNPTPAHVNFIWLHPTLLPEVEKKIRESGGCLFHERTRVHQIGELWV